MVKSHTDSNKFEELGQIPRPAGKDCLRQPMRTTLQPGTRVGEWTILRHLADGGTSEVFLVESDGQEGVLKILKPSFGNLPALYARLLNEITALSTLHVDGVVKVISSGDHSAYPYMIVEYLPESFAQRIQKAKSAQSILYLFSILAAILAEVHRLGIVHRDIKPQNIMFGKDGSPQIIDFGLAKFLDVQTDIIPHSTETGTFLGTREYAAPEQFVNAKAVDGRADIYSLGVMLFEALTGQRPIQAESAEELARRRLTEQPPRLSSIASHVSPQLDVLLMQMLSPVAKDRPTAEQVCERLGRLPADGWTRARHRSGSVRMWWSLPVLGLLMSPVSVPSLVLEDFEQQLDEGDLAQAEAQLDALRSASLSPQQKARVTQKRADLLREIGALDDAASYYEDARQQFSALHADREQEAAMNRLADMRLHQGHRADAQRLYQKSQREHGVLTTEQKHSRGDEFHLIYYRQGLLSIEQQEWLQARETLDAARRSTAGNMLWLARTEERLAALPDASDAVALARSAVAAAEKAIVVTPHSRKAQQVLSRAQYRIARLTGNLVGQERALAAMRMMWEDNKPRGLWAHEYLELMMEQVHARPHERSWRVQARAVLAELETRGQWRGDVHLARWKAELGRED